MQLIDKLKNVVRMATAVTGLLLMLVSGYSVANNKISVKLDPTHVVVGEIFTIRYGITGVGVGNTRLNFSGTNSGVILGIKKNFHIVAVNFVPKNRYVNGKLLFAGELKLTLRANKVGVFVIPSLRIKNRQSPSVTIKISKSDKRFFAELEATASNPYVQQQVGVLVKIYYPANKLLRDKDIEHGSIKILSGDAIIQDQGRAFPHQKTINGNRYRVTTHRFTVLPQRSGTLKIQPLKIFLLVPGNSVTRKVVTTKSLTIPIQAKPAAFTGSYWLPTESLFIKEKWQRFKSQVKVGDNLTRKIHLEAKGLTAEQMPPVTLPPIQGLDQYPSTPKLITKNHYGRLTGIRKQEITIIPNKPGTYTFPAVSIDWWNIKTHKMETATLAARTIRVVPGAGTGHSAGNLPGQLKKNAAANNQGNPLSPSASKAWVSNFWTWIASGFALAWFATMYLWWQKSRRPGEEIAGAKIAADAKQAKTLKAALRSIQSACAQNKPADCRHALVNWSYKRWPDNLPKDLTEISLRLHSTDLKTQITNLNKIVYGTSDNSGAVQNWSGNEFWKLFDQARRRNSERKMENLSKLVPLYPGK